MNEYAFLCFYILIGTYVFSASGDSPFRTLEGPFSIAYISPDSCRFCKQKIQVEMEDLNIVCPVFLAASGHSFPEKLKCFLVSSGAAKDADLDDVRIQKKPFWN
jgi:hypothetical protein